MVNAKLHVGSLRIALESTTLPTKLLGFVLSLMLPAVAPAQTSAFAPYYNKRGLAREAKGDHDGAIADYNCAIDLNPKYAAVFSTPVVVL